MSEQLEQNVQAQIGEFQKELEEQREKESRLFLHPAVQLFHFPSSSEQIAVVLKGTSADCASRHKKFPQPAGVQKSGGSERKRRDRDGG